MARTKDWPAVKIDDAHLAEADKLAADLSSSGLRLTRARVLSAAVVVGLEELRAKPERLVTPRKSVS